MTKYALAKAKDDIEGKIEEPQAKAAEANIQNLSLNDTTT